MLTSSLSTPSSRSSVRSTWLLCAAAKVGDRPRVGLSDCLCLAALPVAAPCPQHDGCFGCRELDESSGRVAAVVQVTPGRGGARMSAGPAFWHLDRTFPSCSLANPLHHPVHPHPRTVAKRDGEFDKAFPRKRKLFSNLFRPGCPASLCANRLQLALSRLHRTSRARCPLTEGG